MLSKRTLSAYGRRILRSKYALERSIYNYRSEDNIINHHRTIGIPQNEDLYTFFTKKIEQNPDSIAMVIIRFVYYFMFSA